MKLSNTFVQGKMNKDIDERLLPKGQYPHAENIRVANTDASDMGAIENVRGNVQLTNLGLVNATTIGAFSDDSNQKLYWFVTSDNKDLVVEYDVPNSQTNIVLESSRPDGVLNFDRKYLITGVVKVINGDSDRDLIVWTDDLNPPRVINIERAKTYGLDGFEEDDISLIKRPPLYSPSVTPTYTPTTLENNMENKFYSFAYRYKYLDGEYSALSSFSNYQFYPSSFDLDFQTMENNGMINSFNAVNIEFNTGSKRVTDVELVFKETNSNTVFLIETFNKENEGWNDNEEQSYRFSNSKVNIALPESELYRLYDNVPRTAKALEMIGTRIVFGNYVEQYDLKNVYGEDINIDYSLSMINKDLSGEEFPTELSTTDVSNDTVTLDLTGLPLQQNNRITLSMELGNAEFNGSYDNTFDYIFNRDYIDANDLAGDEDFLFFVEELMTAHFENNFEADAPDDSNVDSVTPFTVISSTPTSITIQAPVVVFLVDDTPLDPNDNPANTHEETARFSFDVDFTAFYKEIAVDSSLKTNRSYEVGIVYLDKYNRATTVLTDEDNTIYIPQEFSVSQNKIVANINHEPPYWADRYKLVVKQNKGNYQTIYTNLFYEDGLFRWVKLEGANVNKVREGDTLLVKSDLGGVLPNVVKVRVLELATKAKDFIEDNEDNNGSDIIEEAGLYMKIKPVGFDMNFSELTARTYQGSSHLRYPVRTHTNPFFGEFDSGGTFVPYPLNAGSRVRIYINFKARGSISYDATYDKRFRVNGSYASIKEWFEAEVEDLGQFGRDYTRGQVVPSNSFPYYTTEDGEYGYGYGFTPSSGQFYAWAHRDGTASRKITTTIKIEVISSDGVVIFETEPEDAVSDIFYETAQTFDIVDNKHTGNIQDQTDSVPTAIVEMDFFNCYVQGNGAESYRYKDAYNVGTSDTGQQLLANYLNIDLRPTASSIEKYKEVRRFADLTYSEPYNENTNLNALNEFNLSKANYKEDIDKKYGFIQKLYSRDTNLVVFQEDKVSQVLYGKDLLMNADGTSNVSSIEDVLGQQVPYSGEYGISRNPESFAFDAYNIYFMDSKRGVVCRLGRDGITEISRLGLRTWFKDEFKDGIDNKKLGAFDPYLDQYVIHSSAESLNKPITIPCSSSVSIEEFSGTYTLFIDYNIFVGEAGFSFTGNGVPVKYDIYWDDQHWDTGYLGDPSYNAALNLLGLPNVSGGSNGTFTFDKTESLPRLVRVDVHAPFCDTNFSINGQCVEREMLNVISVVLNDEFDEGTTMKSRFKWNNDTYSSPFTTYDSEFEEGEVDIFEQLVGNEGEIYIPITGSNVRVESYKGALQSAEWFEENKLGYLISNTLYTQAQLEDLVNAANFPAFTETTSSDGAVTRFIEFDFDRNSNEQYLYLIWDYRNPKVVINENTKIRMYFDASGSMNSTLEPLEIMRDTIMKDTLLPFYNNDEALYDQNVTVLSFSNERTIQQLNMGGETPDGNVIVMVFQDEASSIYHTSSISPRTSAYNSDIAQFRTRLAGFEPDYFRGVIFQVDGNSTFKTFVQAIQNGTGDYAGSNGLSDRIELNYKYDIQDGGTPAYYMQQIVIALEELGYEL